MGSSFSWHLSLPPSFLNSLSYHRSLCFILSVCFSSSPAEHGVISRSPVGAGSKSAQLDHRHQSQAALGMGHLWAHREAFPLHFKWETNVAGREQHTTVGVAGVKVSEEEGGQGWQRWRWRGGEVGGEQKWQGVERRQEGETGKKVYTAEKCTVSTNSLSTNEKVLVVWGDFTCFQCSGLSPKLQWNWTASMSDSPLWHRVF